MPSKTKWQAIAKKKEALPLAKIKKKRKNPAHPIHYARFKKKKKGRRTIASNDLPDENEVTL